MTKKFFTNLIEHAFVFAAPTAGILIAWLMTFGAFNLINALNDDVFVGLYSVYTFFTMFYVFIRTIFDGEF